MLFFLILYFEKIQIKTDSAHKAMTRSKQLRATTTSHGQQGRFINNELEANRLIQRIYKNVSQ